MNWNQLLEPHWIVVIALTVSFLANLLLLGFFIGRSDRQAMRLVQVNQAAHAELLREIERLITSSDRAVGDRLEEIRRALGRMELREAPPPAAQPSPHPERPSYAGLDKKRHVFALARRGLDSTGIARRLNMYKGEADLVLGLRQFVSASSRSQEEA